MLLLTLAMAVLFFATYFILARSFIKIATSPDTVAKREYRSQTAKMRSTSSALLHRELSHLLSSPTYMLNCALASPILLIAGAFLLIKGADIAAIFEMFALPDGFFTALLAFGVCVLGAMNDMTAPSVSLEGKSIWIAQSMPIEPWQALRAKLEMHLLLTEIPMLLCGICAVIVLQPTAAESVFVIVLPLLYGVLFACIGLFADLKRPNLKWTNEIVPVKQSISAMFVIFGGWVYTVAVVGLYFAVGDVISAWLYLLMVSVLTAGASALLLRWIRTKGAKTFAAL